MSINITKTPTVLVALLKADFIVLWRNRRANMMSILMPLIIVFSWKGFIPQFGGAFVLANGITLGIIAIGLMGYANAVARDRDKGVFQRLRVSPLPLWTIMASRLLVQLSMILLLTIVVFIAGYQLDGILMPAAGYLVTFFVSLVGGALYLSLGQAIVGRVQTPETVSSTTRLIYLAFIMTGMLGQFDYFGIDFKKIVDWSPYGTVKTILAYSFEPSKWNLQATGALMLTMAYTIVFATLSIKWFRWSGK